MDAACGLPRQGAACLCLHLDVNHQVCDGLPLEQGNGAPAVISFCELQCGVKCGAHDTNTHSPDENRGKIEATQDNRCSRACGAKDVLSWNVHVGILDVGAGTGRVSSSGDVAENTEGAGVVALHILCSDQDDHKRISGFVGARRSCATHHALEIGSTEVPASAVGGPKLPPLARCITGAHVTIVTGQQSWDEVKPHLLAINDPFIPDLFRGGV